MNSLLAVKSIDRKGEKKKGKKKNSLQAEIITILFLLLDW